MPEAALIAEIEANGLHVLEVPQRGRNARTGAKESQVSLILAERSESTAPRPVRTRSAIVDERRVQRAIQREQAKIALFPARRYPWRVGKAHALAVGYPPALLATVPAPLLESFCGIAWPFNALAPLPGEVVVDVGAGSGVDSFLAAHLVGSTGQVVGIELTEELSRKAASRVRRSLARQFRDANPRFEKGIAEDLPLNAGFADAVLANGVINRFVVDKERAIAEIGRVLKPGGRLVLADIIVDEVALREERANPERWATALAGPIPEAELLDMLRIAGFVDVAVIRRTDALVGEALEEYARAVGASAILAIARKGS